MISTNLSFKQKRVLFTHNLSFLIMFAFKEGYEVAIDSARVHKGYKSPHNKNSLHYAGLAADLNLYKNNRYVRSTKGHKRLGDFWKTLHPLNRWGGDFGDGNHYSIEHRGRW